MGSRIPSHKLSGGLYVSGRPETPPSLTRPPSLSSRVVYTGGDVSLSGDLAKMFDIPPPSKPPSRSAPHSGSSTRPNSGPIRSSSGLIGPTGLITSGRRSDSTQSVPTSYGAAVTDLEKFNTSGVRVSRSWVWGLAAAVTAAVLVGVFVAVAVRKAAVGAAAAVGVAAVGVMVVTWNMGWRRMGAVGYWKKLPDAELRGAVDGQYVKVTGVVTCGSIPLESSFQKVPRCVYASTELYEYRGWGDKSANPKHRFFSWGCRQAEKYVADFYISDFQSGLRALVKSGYGAKVSVFVEPTTVVDITKDNRESSPSFLRWLSDRSLSSDDRIMRRLKEGYIKEGSTVSVIGIVRRHDNVLMIVPPTEPVSTRCQWFRCLFPTYTEGLILLCDESQTADVIAV